MPLNYMARTSMGHPDCDDGEEEEEEADTFN
jgi:hypothetical protein